MKETKNEEILTEFGVTLEDGRLFVVERTFMLTVVDGPPQMIKKGVTVRLGRNTGAMCFGSGKVAPVEIGEIFKAVRSFRTVGTDGRWLDVEEGDLIKLSRNEAIPLLRQEKVVEAKGGQTE